MPNTKDKILASKLKLGDRHAYLELFNEYKDFIYNIARKLNHSGTSAEDLTQEVFIKVFKSIHSYDGRSKLKTWIYRIAHNTCLSEHRLKINKIDFVYDQEENIEANEFDPLAQLEKNEKQELLDIILSDLLEDEYYLVSLYYREDLSISEIEEITGYKQSNIKIKLFRIRKKLYNLLEDYIGKKPEIKIWKMKIKY